MTDYVVVPIERKEGPWYTGCLGMIVMLVLAIFVFKWMFTTGDEGSRRETINSRDAFWDQEGPELLIVERKLASQIHSSNDRLAKRRQELRNLGKSLENDEAHRRWSAELQGLKDDQVALAQAGNDAYLKHQELAATGNASRRDLNLQKNFIDKALDLAGRVQNRLQQAEDAGGSTPRKPDPSDDETAPAPELNLLAQKQQTWKGTIGQSGGGSDELPVVVTFSWGNPSLIGTMTFPTKSNSEVKIVGRMSDDRLTFQATEQVRGQQIIPIPCDFRGTIDGLAVTGSWTAKAAARTQGAKFHLQIVP